jgi:hypothetical protein
MYYKIYSIIEQCLVLTSRDFLEKHINFADKSEGRYYVYFSAVPSLENTDPEAIDIYMHIRKRP